MKILQLINSLGNGGAEKLAVELSNELAKSHEVILCSVEPIEDWMQPPELLSKNVELKVLNIHNIFSIKYIYSILVLLKNSKPDIVHIHSTKHVFGLFLLSCFYRKTRFIQTLHSTITAAHKKLMNFMHRFRFLNKRFVNVCISEYIFEDFTREYHSLCFEKVDNGIVPVNTDRSLRQIVMEVNGYKFDPFTKVITSIGNYSRSKNFVNLAEIFNEMLLEENNAILLLIGVGRQGEHLRNYQNVSQIKGNNVYQLGFKSNIANFLSVSDALVISSLNEGMPLVALESMSMGVPIITTPAGGMVDIVQDGENGFLAEGFSKENIKSAICRFLNTSDEKLTQMKINNTNRFEQKYSMPICAGKYEELYMKMLGNGNEVEKFGSVEAQ